MTAVTELPSIAEPSHQCRRIQHADAGHLGQTLAGLALRVLRTIFLRTCSSVWIRSYETVTHPIPNCVVV